MSCIEVITATTSAAAASTNRTPTDGYKSVVVSAPGLATTEEVDIYTVTPGGEALFGQTGTVWKLTATIQAIELPAGPVYAFAKDATAASVGVYLDVTVGNN